MQLRLSCRDLGADCEHFVEGESLDQLIGAMATHARTQHGYSEAQASDPDFVELMKGRIRDSTRPSGIRTSDRRGS